MFLVKLYVLIKHTGWLSGKEALFMESLTEEEVAEDMVGILKKFLKKKYIPKPKRVIR